MKRTDHPLTRQAWYSSLKAHSAVMEVFERELMAATGISLAWYDVLALLYLAPDNSMRMCDLADAVLTSRSWLTRKIDQLVKAGLVERVAADDDGRGVAARLTRDGKRTYIKIERVHGRSIDDHFSSLIGDSEARILIETMDRVSKAAREQLGMST
jgi:DNA-binding MarR family transcriptional regulator